jgi:hypothetical protein
MKDRDVYIMSGARTAIGDFGMEDLAKGDQ